MGADLHACGDRAWRARVNRTAVTRHACTASVHQRVTTPSAIIARLPASPQRSWPKCLRASAHAAVHRLCSLWRALRREPRTTAQRLHPLRMPACSFSGCATDPRSTTTLASSPRMSALTSSTSRSAATPSLRPLPTSHPSTRPSSSCRATGARSRRPPAAAGPALRGGALRRTTYRERVRARGWAPRARLAEPTT